VTAIGRDITERKKNEEAIKIFSSAFELATDSIFFADSTGKILHFNEAAYRQRGYTREEMGKMNFQELVVPEFWRN
jgi:PAS domain S-box-containing protein